MMISVGVNTSWLAQNNKTDEMNEFNKRRKTPCVSNFVFCTLYTELAHKLTELAEEKISEIM